MAVAGQVGDPEGVLPLCPDVTWSSIFHQSAILPPRGHWAKSGDIFGCVDWEVGGYRWHLVGKGQGCH